MSIGIIQEFIEESVIGTITEAAMQLGSALSPVLILGMTLYVVVKGYLILSGRIEDPIMDLVFQLIKWSIIITIVTNPGVYTSMVAEPIIHGLPQFLSKITSNNGDIGLLFNNLWATIVELTIAVDETESNQGIVANIGFEMGKLFSKAIIIISGVLMVLILAVPYFLGILIFSLCVLVGPLFISFLAFDVTRGYFQPWISLIITTFCSLLIITLMISMVISFIEDSLTNDLVTYSLGGVMSLMLVGLVLSISSAFLSEKTFKMILSSTGEGVKKASSAMASGTSSLVSNTSNYSSQAAQSLSGSNSLGTGVPNRSSSKQEPSHTA